MKKDKRWKHGNNSGVVSAEYISRFKTEAEFVKGFKTDNPTAWQAMNGNEQILKDMFDAPKEEKPLKETK